MKRQILKWGLKGVSALCLSAAMVLSGHTWAQATNYQIQYAGLDLTYYQATGAICTDGCSFWTNPGDSVDTMNFLVNGINVGQLSSDIGVDVELYLSAGGVDPTIAGLYSLQGSFVDLEIGAISGPGLFTNVTGGSAVFTNFGQLNLGGSGASIIFGGQSLPFSFNANDPVNWSFSSGSGACTGNAGSLVCTYSGTGEVSWQTVPEPASLLLLGAGLMGLGLARRKAQA